MLYSFVLRFSKIKVKFDELVSGLGVDLGVDLGSSNTLIFLKGRGIVVDEPTVIARVKKKRWTGLSAPKANYNVPIAYGLKAKEMLNREPKQMEVVFPIRNGIISDMEAAESLISYYLKLVYEIPTKYPKLFKPRVIVAVPSFVTDVQKRAVKSIFVSAGAREVILVEDAVLAALGVGLPMDRPGGLVIIDVGGGKTEVTLVSMGGVVVGRGIKTSGGDFDLSVVNFMRMKYGLLIGPNSAERIKLELGETNRQLVVRGRDLETGLPKGVKVGGSEIEEAMSMELTKIVKLVGSVLDEAPPELMDDILKKGLVMVGNGARIKGLSEMVEAETKISTRMADEAGYCVIKGCGELLDNRDLLKKIRLVSGLGK